MARTSNKRRAASDDYESDHGFVEDVPSSKRAKKSSSSSSKAKGVGGSLVDTEGNTYWELSGMRRITISEFKGKKYINIREYYEKDGKDLPGKKGISLPLDQYNKLIELLPTMETTLKGMGVSVPRPKYRKEGEGAGATQDEDDEGDGEEEAESPRKEVPQKKKKNIETTSDEDED